MAYEWIVDALDETWRSINDVVRPHPPAAYDAMTACPGWSVRDVLSHLLGFELLLQGAAPPEHDENYPDYVKNEIGRINEAYVEAGRNRPGIAASNRLTTISSPGP